MSRAAPVQTSPLQLTPECCQGLALLPGAGAGSAAPIPSRNHPGRCSRGTLWHSLQMKHGDKHYHPPRNAFCCSSTRGWALQRSTQPYVLPRAAPILYATCPVGHKELPNSPPTPQPPHREQDTASPRAVREGEETWDWTSWERHPVGDRLPTGSSQEASGALPFTPGMWLGWRTTAALAPGRECQAFSGYKAFLGSRPKHSPADHTAWQTLQLP